MITAAREREGLVAALAERGITDARVLAAMASVPRDMFVDPAHASSAWIDSPLPIACGQTISQPYIVAYMTERLGIAPHHAVLEVGTGSGYQAAILARLCRDVFTIERHPALHEAATACFARLGIANITAIVGDGAAGWPEPRTFDRILVTAAARRAPEALLDTLAEGGRMILPLGPRSAGQYLVQFDRAEGRIARTELLAVRFVPLIGGKP